MRFHAGLGRVAAVALVVFGLVVVPVQSVQAAPAVGEQPAAAAWSIGGWIQAIIDLATGGAGKGATETLSQPADPKLKPEITPDGRR